MANTTKSDNGTSLTRPNGEKIPAFTKGGMLAYQLRRRKRFTMAPVKARVETAAKTLERLRKTLKSDMDSSGVARALSTPTGAEGYKITVTNGHWALLEPTPEKLTEMAQLKVSSTYKRIELCDPEFHNTIKRAETVADVQGNHAVYLLGKGNQLTVYAGSPNTTTVSARLLNGAEFCETVELSAKVNGEWFVALNVDYLEPILGCWPVTVYYRDPESPLVFEPQDKSWRYVLMPIRDNAAAIQKAVKAMGVEL